VAEHLVEAQCGTNRLDGARRRARGTDSTQVLSYPLRDAVLGFDSKFTDFMVI
jgi:hypothetical protein